MTATTTTSRRFYAVFSPRGFVNEIACRSFETKSAAEEFKSGIGNHGNGNGFVFDSSDYRYNRAVRAYKKNFEQGGKEYAESTGYGYEA